MARKTIQKIEFDQPPNVDEMLEALEDLRVSAGPAAVVRFTGVIEVNMNGQRVAALAAERVE